ncbi:hypothetical protein [Candidatus Uabimicrobium amorphum]|uniref:Transposase IS4-like domain-containing protein n=1 Tax=Uabimicrobium amorphum TaxID=2596890 RepID=A0A5S9F5M6_UABAM|nr:hypothetical protein [Candidatus Uabimicrobium amorphum]BBM82512.1 hypothetical protein UABAM_00855 [Candidatus Uabimicrobium amorphum]BBM86155.1 hypothetical protein UABAM_04541 [Candidatus Uabimicrobium amorphum]BBM86227.1 hypothetical protein UABAM_04613 [Candidatus Uabimicrobium amorphum]BBM86283.1 hypothetical protein UABAM_04669 [Candidatus Uabimicrobium amorphum]BBM86289.1 hypothetical protein UABAM_04675 [Candidatus Uabimicrobium amorphum]
METGIPLIDRVQEIYPWYKSEEYKKLEERYGTRVKETLNELILYPIFQFDSINDISQTLQKNKNKYYDLLKDKDVDWWQLIKEISFGLLVTFLKKYRSKKEKSSKSRWKIRLILDSTIIKRWGRKMAYTFNVYNPTDRCYMHAQKLLFFAVCVGKDKFIFPLAPTFITSKQHPNHVSPKVQIKQMLLELNNYVHANGLTLDGVRMVTDSEYSIIEVMKLAKQLGLEFYGALKSSWVVNIDSVDTHVLELKNGCIPKPPKHSHSIGLYYRLNASHNILGDIALLIKPYFCPFTRRLKYSVFLSSNPNVNSNVIHQEHSVRWKIENMFRDFKHVLAIASYHGTYHVAQNASFAISSLRFIFARLSLKVAALSPSLRWNIKNTKFTLTKLSRYIRDHYFLDSKSFKLKRLQYSPLSSVR